MGAQRNLYGSAVNPTWNKDITDPSTEAQASSDEKHFYHPTEGSRDVTMFAVVACLNLESWSFHTPLVEFQLKPQELVMGMHVGPVQRETLTRGVFVHTTSQLRVFSLETGVEFISGSLPVATPSLVQSSVKPFRPLLGALCPVQVQ